MMQLTKNPRGLYCATHHNKVDYVNIDIEL